MTFAIRGSTSDRAGTPYRTLSHERDAVSPSQLVSASHTADSEPPARSAEAADSGRRRGVAEARARFFAHARLPSRLGAIIPDQSIGDPPGFAVEGVHVAKSKGRTSRPQRTSRTTAKPESTTDDAAVVEETDVEVTATDATGDTETVEVTEIEVTETDADEDTDAEETDADDDAAASAKDEKKSEGTAKDSKDRVSKDKDSKDSKADSAKSKDAKGGKKTAAKRTSRSGNPAKRSQGRKTASYTSEAGQQTIKPNPRWFLPVLIGLLLVGLIWLVTFYITQGAFPVEAWGNWNILIGFAFFVAGLIMSTRWR